MFSYYSGSYSGEATVISTAALYPSSKRGTRQTVLLLPIGCLVVASLVGLAMMMTLMSLLFLFL